MKKIVSALALLGMVGAPGVAMAEETSPHTLTANVTLTSDYVFRGISQTGGDPAIQGGFDYSHASGIYVGTWASNVGWIEDYQGYDSGNMEIDLYGGYRGSAGDFTYDVGIIGYYYPGDRAGAVTGDTTELYIGGGWKWFSAKYSYSLSNETFGFANSDGSDYLEINASYPVGESGLTLGAHWGTFSFDNNGAQDYDDYSVSATYDLGKLGGLSKGMTVGLKYTDTNADKAVWTDNAGSTTPLADGEYLGDDTFVFWVSKAF